MSTQFVKLPVLEFPLLKFIVFTLNVQTDKPKACPNILGTVNVLKFRTLFVFISQIKMLVIRAGIH